MGDEVAAGDLLATLHYNDPNRLADAQALTEAAFEVEDGPVDVPPLIYEEVR